MKWQVVAKKVGRTEAATIGRAGILHIRELSAAEGHEREVDSQ
jgi:hypothetical protein